ncbi:MAG: arginase family protein [Bacteriovoracaceae bacterium]|nr:arginase family protein [Bacteriovoracaceae bacterium]
MAPIKKTTSLLFSTLLRPPGSGLHTVSSGNDVKSEFWNSFYQTKDYAAVEAKYAHSWKEIFNSKKINQLSSTTSRIGLLGMPFDGGAGIMRGSNWGPLFIRHHFQQLYSKRTKANHLHDNVFDLFELFDLFDLGDIFVNPHLIVDEMLRPSVVSKIRKSMNHPRLSRFPVSPYSSLMAVCEEWHKNFPLFPLVTLGGDHGMSWFTFQAWLKHVTKNRKISPKKLAVIHFDAHTDLLKERLGVDFCFGTWAYHASKKLNPSERLIQIGIRSSGKDKKFWESTLGVKQYWTDELIKMGTHKFLAQLKKHLEQLGVEEVYLSFDIDALDVSYASSTGTAEKSGLSLDFICETISFLSHIVKISGADLVEVAPWIQSPMRPLGQLEPETTLNSASVVLQSILAAMARGLPTKIALQK